MYSSFINRGTSGLNEESERQARKKEYCECSDQNRDETILHFPLKYTMFEGYQ
eukprot:Awhi_evm1s1488